MTTALASKTAPFRAKRLDIGCFINVRVLRDHSKRKAFAQHETERQALRHIIRNTTLPQRTRAEAQLQLSQMHCYTRSTQIKNRCIAGGKGRGVFSDVRMARVSYLNLSETQLPPLRTIVG
ncbi:MAG: 40S ribosomal protein mrp2, mitochondrial [Piccolia ochrophora]|nr:MAG: 40S ribosomal protein mrp2, mitochondrial [Piccolia ochrophora]